MAHREILSNLCDRVRETYVRQEIAKYNHETRHADVLSQSRAQQREVQHLWSEYVAVQREHESAKRLLLEAAVGDPVFIPLLASAE